MLRCTAVWNNFTGAPGFTNHYFDLAGPETTAGAQAAVDRMRTFFNAMTIALPTTLQISFLATVDQVDVATGMLNSQFTVNPPGGVSGIQGATFAGPAGACVNWRTDTIVNGRRLRGKTFIVPLSTAAYENNGTLTGESLNSIRSAATAYVADGPTAPPRLAIWHRPISGVGGSLGIAQSATVADKVAILTSRRQ